MLSFYIVFLIGLSIILYLFLNSISILSLILLIINAFLTLVGLYICLKKKIITIDLIFWIFNLFFFVIAVTEQLQHSVFPNNYPIILSEVNFGLGLICIWNLLYLLFRKNLLGKDDLKNKNFSFKNLAVIQPYYLGLSWISFLLTFGIFGIDYFYGYSSYMKLTNEKTLSTLITTVINGIVYSAFIFQLVKTKKNIVSSGKLIMSIIPLIYMISPFNTTRYIIGFFLIFTILIFFRSKVSSYVFLIILVLGIIFVFPFLNLFMMDGYVKLDNNSINSGLFFNQFNQLHFDAFASFIATIKYTESFSPILGSNLIGAILFFVPRAIWPSKPLGSGNRIGEYLINNYGFSMDNLSNPLVSEFFLSFGVFGVVAGSILMAKSINKIEKYVISGKDNYYLLYGIIAGFLFIILRGSLTVAVASLVGTLVIIVVIPFLFWKFLVK